MTAHAGTIASVRASTLKSLAKVTTTSGPGKDFWSGSSAPFECVSDESIRETVARICLCGEDIREWEARMNRAILDLMVFGRCEMAL